MSTGLIGLIVLAIVIALFLFDKLPGTLIALIGCLLLFFFAKQPFSTIFGGFANPVTILIVASMAIGVAMFDTGAAQVVARAIVRITRDNELAFIIGGAAVSGVLSMWLANTAVVACFLPIIESVALTSEKMKRKNLTLSITFGAMYGGACTLVGSTPQITAAGILANIPSVPEIGMFGYMKLGIILFAWYLIYTAFIGYPLGKKIWGNREETKMDIEEDKAHDIMNAQYDSKKVTTMMVVFLLMVGGYLWGKYPPAIIASTAVVLILVLDLTTFKSLITNIDWNVGLMLGALLGFAAAFEGSGAGVIIANGVMNALGDNASPLVLLMIVTIMTIFLSNFCSNAATVVIFLPMVIPIAQAYGFSVLPFVFGIVFVASYACSTPIAHAQIMMTMVAGYRFSDYFRWTWSLTIGTMLLIWIFAPIFYPFY